MERKSQRELMSAKFKPKWPPIEPRPPVEAVSPSFSNTKEDDSSQTHERFMNALNFFKEIEKTESKFQSESVSTKSEPCLDEEEDEEEDEDNYDPAVQPKSPVYNYVDDLYKYTGMAIQYYNIHQDDRIELVDPLYLRSFVTSYWFDGEIRHVGFIARKRKFPSQLKLFFAEFGSRMVVKICTPIDPGNPFVQVGCGACHPQGVIYHPFAKYHRGSGFGGCSLLSAREASAKRFLSEAYTIKSIVKDLWIGDAYELENSIYGHALKALEEYNYKNDAFYELSEIVSCTRFVCKTVPFGGIFWAHLTFIAKIKDRTDTAVHFFAEVGFDVDMVTTCVIVPIDGDSAKCSVCRDVSPMFHPRSGIVAGYNGGTYADSLWKGIFRGVRSELLPKDDAASVAARQAYYKSLECVDGQCASSS